MPVFLRVQILCDKTLEMNDLQAEKGYLVRS